MQRHFYLVAGFLIIASFIFINVVFSQDYSAQTTACNVAGGTWQGTYCQYPNTTSGTYTSPSSGCGGSGQPACPIYGSSDPAGDCTRAGGSWTGTACNMPSGSTSGSGSYTQPYSGTTYSSDPATACSQTGGTWKGTYCYTPPLTGTTYSSDPAVTCSQGGGTWNSSTNSCQMPGSYSGSYSSTALTADQMSKLDQCTVDKIRVKLGINTTLEAFKNGSAGLSYSVVDPVRRECANEQGLSSSYSLGSYMGSGGTMSGGCGGTGQPACPLYTYPSSPYPSTGNAMYLSGTFNDCMTRKGSSGAMTQIKQWINSGGSLRWDQLSSTDQNNVRACESESGVNYTSPGTTYNNQVKHAWQFKDSSESSMILNRTDQEYQDFIARTHAQCLLISRSQFKWKSNAGDSSSSNWQNFGIPDCSSGQISVPAPKPPVQVCIQVLTWAKNPQTGEERTFPTPCDVPSGWVKRGEQQPTQPTQPKPEIIQPEKPRYPEGSSCPIKDIQRSAKQMAKEIDRLNKRVNQFVKLGITIPSELQTNLKELQDATTKLKSITKCEDMNDIDQQSISESMQNVNEAVNKLERLTQFPKMLKRARSEIKSVQKQFNRLASRAKRSAINVSSILENVNTAISELVKSINTAEASYKAGDAESADDSIQTFYQDVSDVREDLNQVESVFNLSKFIKSAQREIKNYEREIRTFKRQKIDTTEMEAVIKEAKAWLQDVQSTLKAGISSIEDVMELMDRGNDIRQDFQEARQDAISAQRGAPEAKKQYPFLQQFLPRLQIPTNLLKALVKPNR